MNNYRTYLKQSEQVSDIADTIRIGEKVAISDYHRLKKNYIQLKDYVDAIHQQLVTLNIPRQSLPKMFRRNRFAPRILLIIGGNKGIVGNAHHRLLDEFVRHSSEYQKVFVIGKRIENMLGEIGFGSFEALTENQTDDGPLSLNTSSKLMDILLSVDRTQSDGPIDLLYPSYKSISEYEPTFTTFLPLVTVLTAEDSINSVEIGIPIYEPDKKNIGQWLFNRYTELELHRILVEAQLSLLTARMLSMEHVATQAEEMSCVYHTKYTKEKRRFISQRQVETYVVHMLPGGNHQ